MKSGDLSNEVVSGGAKLGDAPEQFKSRYV